MEDVHHLALSKHKHVHWTCVHIRYHTSLEATKFKILNPQVNTKGVEIVSLDFEGTNHVRFMSLKQCSQAFLNGDKKMNL
jgi:hypothetical protein